MWVLGLTTGACLAHVGHRATCLDKDEERVTGLTEGWMPIYELGLRELVEGGVGQGRLRFSTGLSEAVQEAEVIWSNVNPVGVRGVYDEAKRYAEAITMAYHRHDKEDTRIVRIFNTYGPRMTADDGRMVPNFIQLALLGRPLTVYGEGIQSRSVQYVDDLMDGVLQLMKGPEDRPVNIGNPLEYSVRQVAEMILEIAGSRSGIVYEPLPEDDPKQRRPDITRARSVAENLGTERGSRGWD
jgi:nucleoside-diphosphate-sugar epimerase